MTVENKDIAKMDVISLPILKDGGLVDGRRYRIVQSKGDDKVKMLDVEFHAGELKDGKFNGITSESLLEILIHRLNVLESEKSSFHNTVAIRYLEMGLNALNLRNVVTSDK